MLDRKIPLRLRFYSIAWFLNLNCICSFITAILEKVNTIEGDFFRCRAPTGNAGSFSPAVIDEEYLLDAA